jgi:L-asparaginase II
MRGEPLVMVRRGDLIESSHNVAACAVDRDGRERLAIGDVDVPLYLRSAAKPFIAAAVVASGAADRFGLDSREIAVMAASHNGEMFHLAAVRSILVKIGIDEGALQCGAHPPYDESTAQAMRKRGESPSAIHNNCSGKHAGILALCCMIGADTRTYLDANNPSQQWILEICGLLSAISLKQMPIAVDGCGIPVYAVSLRQAAISYMRLATLRGVPESLAHALQRVRTAMIEYPEYVSGTGEFDAAVMRAGSGSIACKGGAEGVHGSALLDAEMGLVLKVIDGAERARAPAAIAILKRLGALEQAQLRELAAFARPALRNRAGLTVGDIQSVEVA